MDTLEEKHEHKHCCHHKDAGAPINMNELDHASKSLSEALRLSFGILKVIMVILVVLFIGSGIKMIAPEEQAIVLRFGKIVGAGETQVLNPGLHWTFPYPIDEVVRIPVTKKINLPMRDFWYFQQPGEILKDGPKDSRNVDPTLDPISDGYCITRSVTADEEYFGVAGSDYSLVHTKWQLTYQIDNPVLFFKNVYVNLGDIMPGQNYSDVIEKNVTDLLQSLASSSIVIAMTNYTIDEAIYSTDRIPRHVESLLQEKLDIIKSGIRVVSVQLTDSTWPRQVDAAFAASIRASQAKEKFVYEAQTYAKNMLNEAAGPVAGDLLNIMDDPSVTEEQKEMLWLELAGKAQEEVAQSRAYRRRVVENAKANWEYLRQILPEYQKRPELVLQKIYQDAIEEVFANADEKIIMQPNSKAANTEVRVMLNRDPVIKQQKNEQQKQ